ncbi:MAG TPA: ABC transporter ATP-binding protein [Syntrophomonadaceae bacterium]|nr:ABC transporter ATP-binding protein [Syntrophomonadaceae bacterium]
MEPILEIKGLNKHFNGFDLQDINMVLPRGYIMGLIGPNGAGKTTIIKLIMNLINKDSGEIKIFGQNSDYFGKTIKQKIGFVYDESHFYEYISIIDNKRIIAPFYQNWDDELFNHYLSKFQLQPRKKIKDLSRGMKTKFALAMALSHRAELIIMDEPTSGLDPVFRRELLDLLTDLMQDENCGIIFSTHITTDLERVADYICLVNQGKVIFSDTRDSILETYQVAKGSRELLGQKDICDMLQGVRDNQFGFEALTREGSKLKRLYGDKVVLDKASLDDIILYTARGSLDV